MTKQDVIFNLQSICCNLYEMKDEIILSFEDFNHEGITEVIVDFQQDNCVKAYLNHKNADIFHIEYKSINDEIEVVFVEVH